jgi:2-polyprenyl-3-methyl-5-hydroxy-6-metoxy-1,4-benzoquinol methylase
MVTSSYKKVSRESYEEDYTSPYHWLLNEYSLQGIEYFGYLKIIVSLVLDEGKTLKILDVGCGDGRLAAALSNLGFKVIGIDFSQNAINYARKLVPKADFVCMDIYELGKHKEFHEQFDVAVLMDVLEHLNPNNYQQVFKDLSTVLHERGTLILSVPSTRTPLTNIHHYKHFSLSDIKTIINESGLFTIEKIIGNHHCVLNNAFVKSILLTNINRIEMLNRMFIKIYARRFLMAPLDKASRYIIKARRTF